ncbi:MAG: acyl-ACP--UDP-N-acetylglucosamine O-acyltransferase [bacterium]|nr:MAG: acyl-ACP--UDP-N-acetylglucosamine O-acyltransferase [bacterium]
MPTEVDSAAIIHTGAELGANVTVGPYSIIGEHARIGDNCVIGSCVLVDGHTILGNNNRIFHGACIGSIPQDMKYKGATSFVEIGSGNVFREYVTVNSATNEGESTIIGDGNLLMAYVHVAHNCRIGDNVILANAVNLAGHVTIQDYAIVGGVTPVHQFVSIGAHSFIGGGSRIPKDIPPYIKVAGNPPRIGGINSIGLKRRGFTIEQRVLIKKAYCILYRSELNVSQALERIEREIPPTPEIEVLVEFIRSSKRGITK